MIQNVYKFDILFNKMGCLISNITTVDVLHELKQLYISQNEMVTKYEEQLERINIELAHKVKKKCDKSRIVSVLRRRKIIQKYIETCEMHMGVCTQKQCALEQLEITRMQLQAIKNTSNVFKRFSKKNTIDKIQQLQDDMEVLHDNMMDISDIVQTPFVDEFDVEEEMEELMRQNAESTEHIEPIEPIEPTEQTDRAGRKYEFPPTISDTYTNNEETERLVPL